MFRIVDKKHEWSRVLDEMDKYDFYHTYDYHSFSKGEEDVPILIVYKKGGVQVAIPLLVRSINDTYYKDATSVYGYAGPLSANISEDFNISSFHILLHEFLYENNIVTIFSRLNPFISSQDFVLNGLGEVRSTGKVVFIDLTEDLEVQRHHFNKTTKLHCNRTQKHCTVRVASSQKEVSTFIDIYYRTMQRVGADSYYFFSEEYFYNLLNSSEFKAEVVLCSYDETQEILGGALFVTKNGIVQYHLSATNHRYEHIYPTTFIIDEMRKRATQEGCSVLNLGGGKGSTEDSLYSFKSGFSKDYKEFKTWRWVVNPEVNQELISRHESYNSPNFSQFSTKFFPVYRIKIHN